MLSGYDASFTTQNKEIYLAAIYLHFYYFAVVHHSCVAKKAAPTPTHTQHSAHRRKWYRDAARWADDERKKVKTKTRSNNKFVWHYIVDGGGSGDGPLQTPNSSPPHLSTESDESDDVTNNIKIPSGRKL